MPFPAARSVAARSAADTVSLPTCRPIGPRRERPDTMPPRISTSVGAVVSDGDLGPVELIRRADQAMYAAKQRLSAPPREPSRT